MKTKNDVPDPDPFRLLDGILLASRASNVLDRILWGAVMRNDSDTFKLMFDIGSDIEWAPSSSDLGPCVSDTGFKNDDLRNRIGATPLWVAAEAGNETMVMALLESGARPDRAAADGTTPFQVATSRGHLNVVRVFQKYFNEKLER